MMISSVAYAWNPSQSLSVSKMAIVGFTNTHFALTAYPSMWKVEYTEICSI